VADPLIIVGAGGHGRETAWTLLLASEPSSFLGFLDDRASGITPEGWPILGSIEAASVHRKAAFLVAINDPRTRRDVVRRLEALGISRWASVVDPDVRLSGAVRLGEGCSILGGCRLTTNIRIGRHVILNRCCQVSHDCTIGCFCSFNPGSSIAGAVSIGDGCELGGGCLVRQGVTIGAGATIGMGSVVLEPVAGGAVVVGNPARLLRCSASW